MKKKFLLIMIGLLLSEKAWVKTALKGQNSPLVSNKLQKVSSPVESNKNLESQIEVFSFYSQNPKPFWDLSVEADHQFAALSPLSEINDIEKEKKPLLTRSLIDRVLVDYDHRIGDDFKIPDLIFNQTKFWFRIYTEFDSRKKVIHDSLHPHIIFDVVDVGPILDQPMKAKWMNVQKADQVVRERVKKIRSQLLQLAKKNQTHMTAEELGWLAQFENIQGNRKKILERAAQSVRVQTGQKDFYQNALYSSGFYLRGIEAVFEKKKMPPELSRLPFVESSFVIGATSKVGAAGIWQIMPGVGRKFLTINDQIDERRNPWKATETAAKLLKENHMILYKKWGLALTAYNHGPGGVKRAIQATRSKEIAQIVRQFRSKNFDFASANFYTCFLAALYAEKYSDQVFPQIQRGENLVAEEIFMKKPTPIQLFMKVTQMDKETLLKFNPELDRAFKYNFYLPKGFRVMVPGEIKLQIIASVGQEYERKKTN